MIRRHRTSDPFHLARARHLNDFTHDPKRKGPTFGQSRLAILI